MTVLGNACIIQGSNLWATVEAAVTLRSVFCRKEGDQMLRTWRLDEGSDGDLLTL
jgi:hypothetical protein